MTTLPCGCPADRRITDAAKHTAWHALVVEQGIPAGPVNAAVCIEARGLGGDVGLVTGKRR